jgi:ketosteroid isomerase-like protein
MTNKAEIVRQLLATVEASKPDEYIGFFTEDAVYKIGSLEPVIGIQKIRQFSSNIMQLIESVSHNIIDIWETENIVICHVIVNYKRKDNKVFAIPSISIIQFKNNKIQKYQAFIDASPVFS